MKNNWLNYKTSENIFIRTVFIECTPVLIILMQGLCPCLYNKGKYIQAIFNLLAIAHGLLC